jgi:hypothetical protein
MIFVFSSSVQQWPTMGEREQLSVPLYQRVRLQRVQIELQELANYPNYTQVPNLFPWPRDSIW